MCSDLPGHALKMQLLFAHITPKTAASFSNITPKAAASFSDVTPKAATSFSDITPKALETGYCTSVFRGNTNEQ